MWSRAIDLITGLGVIGVAATIWSVRRAARLQFEQHFTDRYRAVIACIPLDHLLRREPNHLKGDDPARIERAYFDYFELCEEQFYYRRTGRISNATWHDWEIGIRANGSLPAFRSAWGAFAEDRKNCRRADLFDELEKRQPFGETVADTIDPIASWRLQALSSRIAVVFAR
jgi:hypothetical protein